jgi:hypothetical protein
MCEEQLAMWTDFRITDFMGKHLKSYMWKAGNKGRTENEGS